MIAAKQPIITYPTRTNQIPRHVPPPHWASHPYVLFAAAGLLPFGTIFVELYFAMTSIWQVCFFFSVQPVMVWLGLGIISMYPCCTMPAATTSSVCVSLSSYCVTLCPGMMIRVFIWIMNVVPKQVDWIALAFVACYDAGVCPTGCTPASRIPLSLQELTKRAVYLT